MQRESTSLSSTCRNVISVITESKKNIKDIYTNDVTPTVLNVSRHRHYQKEIDTSHVKNKETPTISQTKRHQTCHI